MDDIYLKKTTNVIKEVFDEMNLKIRNIKYTFQIVIWNYESKTKF